MSDLHKVKVIARLKEDIARSKLAATRKKYSNLALQESYLENLISKAQQARPCSLQEISQQHNHISLIREKMQQAARERARLEILDKEQRQDMIAALRATIQLNAISD